MIAHVGAYKCEHVHDYVAHRCVNDCAHVCILAWACTRLCVHMHADMITHMSSSMIAPMCAYSCRHDCAHLARWLVWMKILRAQDKTKRVQLEMRDSAYAHTCASMLMRHSGKLFGTKVAQSLGAHGSNQVSP